MDIGATRIAPIRPGDTIGVFAPASPIQRPMLEAGIAALEARGYRVRTCPDVDSSQDYLAGDDDRRVREWNDLVSDPAVRALWAARGGYGSGRIAVRLDLGPLQTDPRMVIGSSDLTAVHLVLGHAGLPSLYGPMVASDGVEDRAGFDEVFEILEGRRTDSWSISADDTQVVCNNGTASGALTGGCLSLVAAACGTDSALVGRDRIVVLEDVGERPYRIDRMLTQVRQAGCLDGARAVVFGQMPGCTPSEGDDIARVLEDRLSDLGCPVLLGLPVGHVRGQPHRCVPFGMVGRIDGALVFVNETPVTNASNRETRA